MNLIAHQKLGQSGLLYWPKSPAEKSGRERAFPGQLSLTAHRMFVILHSFAL